MDDVTGRLTTLEAGSTFAGYRIEGIVARGGMGVVYKASDPDLDRAVALKIIAPEHTQNPDAVTRFKSEARLAASLEHPNIVPIHRGGEYQGVLYLAMRFVPGTNLRHLVDTGRWRWGRSCWSRGRWRLRSTPRTSAAWCIATSSRPTS